MKKLFFVSLLAMLSLCANAYDFEANGIYYNITGANTVEVTKNANGEYAGNIVIPNSVIYDSKEYSVTSIGDYAFEVCRSLTSIKIPESVTNIGGYAFYWCDRLTSINIPESVESIGERAFEDCRSLTSINIPESVTSIGNQVFRHCIGLTSIVVASGNCVYDSRNDCNAIIRTSDNCLVQGCKNTVIPYDVTSIGDYAFVDCSGLTSINIPESVTSIGGAAFASCSLTSIKIPESVTSIGYAAFSDCSSLTSIHIPEGVTSIEDHTFYLCSRLELINIPEGVTSIGQSAFLGCSSLTSISIPKGVTSIGMLAFSECGNLTSINIPKGVTTIGNSAFSFCRSLKSVTIPESVISIADDAFAYCGSLADIYCYAFTPADIVPRAFSQETYKHCTLHVPYGTIDAYKAAEGWKNFFHIVEFAPTGVEAVPANDKSADEQRIYNLGGVRMSAPQRGLNIINGKKYLKGF